jgi:periplasmic divalent cation tolerance protein
MATGVSVVLVTAPSEGVARAIARTLVEENRIACANLISGVRSIYRWEGALSDESEVLMVLKAPDRDFDALRARIVELHPYEVPEIIRLEVADGHAPYLEWVLSLHSSGTSAG